MKTLFRTAVLTLALAAPLAAQDKPFNWRKAVPAGKTLEIRGVIGDIVATAATGNEVEVVATKRARRSDPSSVEIKVVEHEDGVTICAIYDDSNDCEPGHSRSSNRENDTHVDFEVRVPRGVRFKANTVMGDIRVSGLDARVSAGSVSGDVRIATSDIANASTVSGSVEVSMGRTDWEGTLSFSTVSGDIDVQFGADLNAEVSYNTVSGNLDSEWPIAMSRGGARSLRGTVGKGGRKLTLTTVSGDVDLRRAN
jgi:hypothetical protein